MCEMWDEDAKRKKIRGERGGEMEKKEDRERVCV